MNQHAAPPSDQQKHDDPHECGSSPEQYEPARCPSERGYRVPTVPDEVVARAREAMLTRSGILQRRIADYRAAHPEPVPADATRFPPDVSEALRGLGWRPGRDVRVQVDAWLAEWVDDLAELPFERDGYPRYEPIPAALQVLYEFGGLYSLAKVRVAALFPLDRPDHGRQHRGRADAARHVGGVSADRRVQRVGVQTSQHPAEGPLAGHHLSAGQRIPPGPDTRQDLSTHKTPAIKAWLGRHPRFHVHFTPTGSSWINQVERWFSYLTTDLLQRGVYKNVQALEKDIRRWIHLWNADPKPFV